MYNGDDVMTTNEEIGCACGKQIIWFWGDDSVIYACEECEITFHHSQEKCPHCGSEVTEFIKKRND